MHLLDEKAMNARTEELLSRMNASIPTEKQVAFLSGGAASSHCHYAGHALEAKLIVMDEPTAALGVA
jgi:ABC-type sugar transport system ATPase subunit